MTDTQAARTLARMKAQYAPVPYDPTVDVTVQDIAALLGLKPHAARELLAREVEAGRMTVRKCTINGKARNVYRDV